MDCHDARERFSALLDGELGLTEWTETEAHVSRCAECGVTLEKLHRLRRPEEPGCRRPPMAYVAEPSYLRGAIGRLGRLRRSTLAFRLLVGATAIAMVLGIVSYTASVRSALDVAARALVSWATSTSQADAPAAKPFAFCLRSGRRHAGAEERDALGSGDAASSVDCAQEQYSVHRSLPACLRFRGDADRQDARQGGSDRSPCGRGSSAFRAEPESGRAGPHHLAIATRRLHGRGEPELHHHGRHSSVEL
ncbi:MAG: zf-HC2 domain-containing protein [Actinobacteria bacterium]|nr:MAG: zf-HC2 domain-containing protein [Actinomycetota bacterium]